MKSITPGLLLVALLSACGGGGAPTTAPVSLPTIGTGPAPTPAAPGAQANRDGSALTTTAAGFIDTANPFFKPLGNGRSCATCHAQAEGWSITPPALAARFANTNGTDPVFRLIDGANSPNALAVTLDQKRLAYSMLLTKGLIRVGLPVPAGAEFTLLRADDPYGYASATELSLFRRPLASTNLKFASSVMWDNRETTADANSTSCIRGAVPALCFGPIDADLLHQANGAVRGHAEAAQDLTAAEQRAIVDFEKSLFTAQLTSTAAGDLTAAGALGGPALLSQGAFYWGINDVAVGDYLSGAPFTPAAMTLFGAWRDAAAGPNPSAQNLARASIARGEQLFNTRPMNIVGVAGFSDTLRQPLQRGTCTSCHNAPNAGSHSVARQFDTGVSAANLRTPDMPLYTLRNNVTGEVVDTTDPGTALISGKWADIGKMKTPALRGLAARPPYFHNGSAATLEDTVRFYDRRFRMGLSPQDVADLGAFLKAL
ncbi:cytochrome C [Massilia glaciei]|nr:cytochrome C [Massilia glaciei]